MRIDADRRVRRLEVERLTARDLIDEWLREAHQWASLEELAFAQAIDPAELDPVARLVERTRSALLANGADGEVQLGRLVAETMLLRKMALELELEVGRAARDVGLGLQYLAAVRSQAESSDEGLLADDWHEPAAKLVERVAVIDRLIDLVERRRFGGRPILFAETIEAWAQTQRSAEVMTAWLPPPTARQEHRPKRRAEYAYNAFVDQCRAMTFDDLGWSDLARRILRGAIVGPVRAAAREDALSTGLESGAGYLRIPPEMLRGVRHDGTTVEDGAQRGQ